MKTGSAAVEAKPSLAIAQPNGSDRPIATHCAVKSSLTRSSGIGDGAWFTEGLETPGLEGDKAHTGGGLPFFHFVRDMSG